MAPVDDSEPLPPEGIHRVQSIVGSILYYARALDSTMLPSLNDIGSKQAAATTGTNKPCTVLLDYAATYPNAKIRFYASDLNLQADSDDAGFFFSEHQSPQIDDSMDPSLLSANPSNLSWPLLPKQKQVDFFIMDKMQ